MGRLLPTVAFLVLAGLLFLMPQADPVRLAALDAWPQEGSDAFEAHRELAAAVLSGASARVTPATEEAPELVTLKLGGVRVASDRDGGDLTVHGLARRSIVRGLRQVAAGEGRELIVEGELTAANDGGAQFLLEQRGTTLTLTYSEGDGSPSVSMARPDYSQPDRTALLPPLLAILMAVLFRRPVIALFAGVWSAAFLLRRAGGEDGVGALVTALPDVVTEFFVPQLTDNYRLQIVGFVFAMLAMVGIMTKSGGVRGMMNLVARLAHDARSTQLATWLMGLVVFFDDYANCILVGSTMRPLSDRFKIAREKLAYLVDSTAAPVAGISIFSTWIAFEVSTFSAQLPAANLPTTAGYQVFIETLPFRFYCILSLFFAFVLIVTRRDFGPMLAAERRARSTGQLVAPGSRPMVSESSTSLQPAEGVTPAAYRALLPVLTFVGVTLLQIFRVGKGAHPELVWGEVFTIEGVTAVLGDGDSTLAILWGSTLGMLVAAVLAVGAGLRGEILTAAWATVRSMGVAIVILYLAWMIGSACDALGTATYLSELVGDHVFAPLLPSLLFLLGAAVAFSTGSSWSTMSILLPLVVGLAYTLGVNAGGGPDAGHLLMLMSIGAVLEGSIFGDHCSPISDTTVLSSTAAASDHIDHVRTQAPYAITVMTVSLGLGYLPCALMGLSPWIALGASALALVGVVFLFGRRVESVEKTA